MDIQADLSVCTTVFKNAKSLKGLLISLYQTAASVSLEIIVVDRSGSVADLYAKEFPELIIYEDLHETNHTKAVNRGLELATGRYVSIWDNDVLVKPMCLKTLLDFLDANPDIGITGPKIVDAYEKTEPSPQKFPSLLPFKQSNITTALIEVQDNIEIEWLQSGVHIIRREAFEEIGCFDYSFTWPFAEMDYYHRAKGAGWHNFFCPNAEIIHPNPARYHPELRPPESFTDTARHYLKYLLKHWVLKRTYFQEP